MTLLTNNSGLQVNKDCSRDILLSPSLTEEGGEGVVVASHRLVVWHLAVRLDSMFQTVQLPAGVPHLDTCLAYVDRDAFTLEEKKLKKKIKMGREKGSGIQRTDKAVTKGMERIAYS